VPTYDYRCDRCERTFEVRQRISEDPLTTCDRCGGPIRRLIASAPFILKGGGWYVTDYPSEGRKKGMEAEKKSSGESTSTPASTSSGTDGAAPKSESAAPKPTPAPTS
jgi:putative FmdB family regulatory protein